MVKEHAHRLQFSENLRGRYRDQSAVYRSTKKHGEDPEYLFVRGDYGTIEDDTRNIVVLGNEESQNERRYTKDLFGEEVFFKDTIAHLLKVKVGKPVIVLDIGAMIGMSWRRLANFYTDQVKAGKIVFVTSNLNNDLKTFIKERLTRQEKAFLAKTDSLIQSIEATPAELRRKKINLPNGTLVSLEHNVDIVHESFSMTAWGRTPDIDILRVPGLLSEYGMYYVPVEDTERMQLAVDNEERIPIMLGIKLAHKQLQSIYGLRKVRRAEEGNMKGKRLNYIVFKKKNASPITVNKQ